MGEHEDEVEHMEKNNNSREIWVNAFTEKSAQDFRDRVLDIAHKDPNAVIPIYIDSYGGFVDSLAKMLATMDEVPNRFITTAMGKAMSCGAILLSHGDLRFCDKYARIMVHNVSSASWGDAHSMKSDADETMRLNTKFMSLLAANCGVTYSELQDAIKASTDSKQIWMDPVQAKKFGIVDHVGVPKLMPLIQWSCSVTPEKEPQQRRTNTKKKKKK